VEGAEEQCQEEEVALERTSVRWLERARKVGARDGHMGDLKSRSVEGKAKIKGIPTTDTVKGIIVIVL